jgi:hypothetical protein
MKSNIIPNAIKSPIILSSLFLFINNYLNRNKGIKYILIDNFFYLKRIKKYYLFSLKNNSLFYLNVFLF